MSPSVSLSPSGIKVLVIDDDSAVLRMLSLTLDTGGYEVHTANNAIEALEILPKKDFAVIVSDQLMPQMTGLEFFSKARNLQPDASRILLTGALELDTVIDAINKGEVYRFMVKPCLREELLATVNDAANRFNLIQQNLILRKETQCMNERLISLNRSLEEQVQRVAEQYSELEKLNLALDQNLRGSVELCLKITEMFYPTIGSQARRVHALCRSFGHALSLPSDESQILEIAGSLFDIGLIGIPRHIIKQWQEDPKRLKAAEFELIRQHPIVGQELANFGYHLKEVGVVIRSHHERFDGLGFPDGLKDEQIPWLGRLLAVAVGYASSSHTGEKAVRETEKQRGTLYDPEAVRVLLRCLPKTILPRKELGVLLAELRPGMVVARAIYNSQGLLIIPEGQQLSDVWIEKLRAHDRISPINQALQVFG